MSADSFHIISYIGIKYIESQYKKKLLKKNNVYFINDFELIFL